jgi:hypothetical protein
LASTTDIVSGGDIDVNFYSFGHHLPVENMSPKTQETYSESVRKKYDVLFRYSLILEFKDLAVVS